MGNQNLCTITTKAHPYIQLRTHHSKCTERTTLLEGDEAGAVGGSQSWLSVSGGNVGHGELGEVVAGHLGPDLDGVENLSVVDGNDRADHLGHDDHVW
jgi:hypothetical protein